MSARPVSHKGQLIQTHTTDGANDIELDIEINGAQYAPWAIRFLSTGTYKLEFQALDDVDGDAITDDKIAIAGEWAPANVAKVLAATTSGLVFTVWY